MQDQIDIAPRASWKAALSGVFQLAVGLPMVVWGLYWLREGFDKYRIDWWFVFLMLTMFLMGWFFFATGVRRLREAFDKSFYVRAGPDGISFRIPEGTWSSLLLGYRIIEEKLTWGLVKTYYSYTMNVNGIPMSNEVRVETLTGGRFSIPSLYFASSKEKMVFQIKEAAGGKDVSLLDSLAKVTEQLKARNK